MTQATAAPSRIVTASRPEVRLPWRLRPMLNLDDFQAAARRRLPRQIYGYYAGASERGDAFTANADSFRALSFVPRTLADVSGRSAAATLFGRDYALPVGIAPMGLSGLSTFDGDVVLAESAAAERIPMVMSATSLTPLERLAAQGGRWFQAYLPGDRDRICAMIDRVAAAGFETFVLTVDVPVAANRESNVRAGFSVPLRPGLRLLADAITHPVWSAATFLRTLACGMPRLENMDAFRGPPIVSRHLVRAIGARDQLDWSHVDLIRDRWRGRFVLKGILAPEDAARARAAGVDGIVVSNHGGRQLDGAVAPLDVLAEVAAEAGDMAVMLDGGVRRGTDVLKALAAGADFVFIGRPFLFAAAVAGRAGVRHAVRLIADEIDRDMAMLGVRTLAELGPHLLRATPRRG